MIGETVSRYRILSRLGRGGMGEVYLARDTELDRDVALKFVSGAGPLDDKTLERFRREARAAAGLRHPNIVTIYEIGEHGGRPFIAMERVEGNTLESLLAAGGFEARRAVDIAVDVCDALAAAHRAGIIHRDLKPANICIDSDGRARILDFGLATSTNATALTEEGTTVGTLAYMSPEQARGERVDARSDLFSLGAVLYEMITGTCPFSGDHPAAIAYAVQNEQPQPLARYSRDATPEMERVVAKALSKDPATRYQSAGDLAADLRGLRGSGAGKAKTGGGGWKSWWWKAAAVAAAALVALFLGRLFTGGGPLDDTAEAGPNTLAIMYFENIPEPDDPQRLGKIATNLLITDLSESRFIRVLSSQRLYDILRLKGKEGVSVIDRDTAGEVARHAGVQRMLLGSILRTRPGLVITSQLVDVGSGEVVASQRVSADPGEDVFSLVDRLSRQIRDDLNLPGGALEETDVLVADVTTHSEEAYRQYVIGLDARDRFQHQRAVEAFTRAVEIDSTFAMAWLQLSKLSGIFQERRTDREGRRALEQAVRYADRVGRRERLYITARRAVVEGDIHTAVARLRALVEEDPDDKDAHMALALVYDNFTAENDSAIAHLRRVIEIDPLYGGAYNQLAYLYAEIRDFDKAIHAANRYVEMAPDQPNPYDSRGDVYASFGMADSAIASYRTAYETHPSFYASLFKLAGVHMLRGDYRRAREALEPLLSADDAVLRATASMMLVTIPGHRGRARDAIAVAIDALAADRSHGLEGNWRYNLKMVIMARAQLRIGRDDECLATFEEMEAREDAPQSWYDVVWKAVHAMALARVGRFEEARKRLDDVEKEGIGLNYGLLDVMYIFRSRIEFLSGDIPSSRRWAHEALDHGGGEDARLQLALCDITDGDPAAAAAELKFQCRYYGLGRMRDSFLAAELHYHLARAYEEAGEAERASQQYREFLDIWKDADPDIRLLFFDPRDPDNRPLTFARRRLEALASGI